ncbi:hypothetical protein F5148DRAFT_1376751 [Russula earlei]|uniref:Uncharacterized protein n=1 Tax=Russula earlei TaxID=71964 RepID=A0ACC0U7A3_9AGAM|nr:hypothetical protein F5148DRAFT_1376751 [Russula earlei]
MSGIEALRVEFQSPRSRPDPANRPRPPLTRSVLPALTRLAFQGVHEYLEDLLAQIEAPRLDKLEIRFFMDLDFVVPHLCRFISHAERFKACNRATVHISDRKIRFSVFGETRTTPGLSLVISCGELDYQLSSLAQVCNPSLLLLSTLVQLDVVDPVPPSPQSYWKDEMETTQWLEVLEPFTSVKVLRLSDQVAPNVLQALEKFAGERITEALPALQNIFLSGLEPFGSVPKFIERFVAARQLSGHPVTIYPWEDW